tara:strand:+ start:2763 stop:4196 length:1434 start_codon:yes stop_codon:yes gene_type:complete
MLFLAATSVTSALVASGVGWGHRKMLGDELGVGDFSGDGSGRSLLGSSDLAALEAGSGTHFALYIIIPFISAVVGYVTNVVALKMTFYPLEFTPAPLKFAQPAGQPFGLLGGWQGIIPAKAGKMAGILCDLMTTKLLDVKVMFGKIHPLKFAEALAPEMTPSMHRIIEDVARREAPEFWEGLPTYVQAELVKQAMVGAPEFLRDVIEDLQNHVYEVLDLKSMVVKLCEANKQDVVRMFQEVGESEFRIIEYSGAYFGFVFGVVQMVVFYIVDVLAPSYSGPLLPAFGFITGYLTNWVALKLIFRPIHPTKILCGLTTIQGAFLRRQKEVSEKFAKLNQELFCNAKNLWEEMMFGRLKGDFGELVMRNTRHFTDVTLGAAKPAATLVLGAETYNRMREHIAEQLVKELPKCVPCSYGYQDLALEVEETVCVAMKKLPPDEFEGVLHPVFEEDEIKLIVIGGCLGALVGLAQYLLVFSS